MILEGNQRCGARDLALHLLKEENEQVEIHEVRGFASDNLAAALNESYAMSRGTKCKQFLYSLSLNPPKNENVTTEVFEDATERAEEKLGLTGQPRAIVFHEKKGRRHAHAVWSRINVEEMKAVPLRISVYDMERENREVFGQVVRLGSEVEGRYPATITYIEWRIQTFSVSCLNGFKSCCLVDSISYHWHLTRSEQSSGGPESLFCVRDCHT